MQQAVAQIPWGHNIVVLDKTDNYETKKWYIYACIENGWSRNILVMQIESHLYERQVLSEKTTNFKERLPAPQSDLVVQTLKDPYIFDFIEFKEGVIEREVEQEMVNNISKLLLELGTGFAFIGNQYHISVGGQDFYIDLLFYNTKLHCYVVIELKNEEFKPEYAGKVNFYLSAVDDLLKTERDNSSVGIILCREKNKLVVEYALKQITSPIGVSEYCLSEHLPKELENILPSAEDIEKRIRLKYSVDNTEREDAENDE